MAKLRTKALLPVNGNGDPLTEREQRFAHLIAETGCRFIEAVRAVVPPEELEGLTDHDVVLLSTRMRRRTADYLDQIVNVAAEKASMGRFTLLEMAKADRDLAYQTLNPSAAVAATKLMAQLAGVDVREHVGSGSDYDPVALLGAVERIVRARVGGDAIDVISGGEFLAESPAGDVGGAESR